MYNQKGFTLIELVVVIVILGILSAVAVPKFVDMRTEAKVAAADGVYGASQSAAALNHAKYLVTEDVTVTPAGAFITDGQSLLDALDGDPEGWVVGTTDTTEICFDEDGDGDCTAANDDYIITVATAEDDTQKAALSKSW